MDNNTYKHEDNAYEDNINRVKILGHFLKNIFNTETEKNDKLAFMSKQAYMYRTKSKYKWDTLVHNGIKFSEEYEYKSVPIIYDGQEVLLSKDAEETAFLYAKYIDSEYVKNNTFNKNFFNDWKKILGKDHIIKSLDKCNFMSMKKYIDVEKENKKIEKEKNKDKPETENNIEQSVDEKYKTAIVNGKIQSVSNYRMEPPGLFIGRGKNPHLGKIKKRIYPEDITINIGKDEKIPEPPENHKWGHIIHDRKVEWLASWKDTITGKTKYLWLSAHSDMKANNDQDKFDLARKLKKKIKMIIDVNNQNMKSTDLKTMQIATALFFIDKLAIRVGNEKADDETDTVGVTSLRLEHIELGEKNTVTLNFLGKDSVQYTNTITVDNIVYDNIKELMTGKEKFDQLFDKITSVDINRYLQEFMKNLTAKVFRTYNASNLFQKELNKITNKYNGNEEHVKLILDEFAKANAKVAKMMNHQKNISVGYKKNVDKINSQITELKKKLKKAKKSSTKNIVTIQKITDKIKNYKSKLELTKEMKNISLGTSKANYIDPRITVAFMKKNKLDVNKLFSKALQEKFKWAFETDENYRF